MAGIDCIATTAVMKICFLIRSLNHGGAERQVSQLAADLKRRGNSVRVVTFYPGGRFEEQLAADGISVTSMNKRGRWHLFGFIVALRRELRRDRPDVIYSFLTTANIVAVTLAYTLRRLPVIWGVRVSDMDLTKYGTVDRLASSIERMLAGAPRLTISNSAAGVARCLQRGFPNERLTHVPNGIDLDSFHPDPNAGPALRRLLGLNEPTPVIGLIARFDPMKGIDVFVKAAKDLKALIPSVHFLLVGKGMDSDNSALCKLIESHGLEGSVSLLGVCKDIPGIQAGLDIATLSSRFGEGFSNVIGEAMACGIPVVATSVGDAAAIIGDTGWIIPAGDVGALSKGWQEALALTPDKRAQMGIDARNRIMELFERQAIAEKTEAALAGAVRT